MAGWGGRRGSTFLLLLVFVAGLASAALELGAARGSVRSGALGDLTSIGCVATAGKGSAACSSTANLAQAAGAAMSPDGKNLYATGFGSSAVEVMTRAANGTLIPSGCIGDSTIGPANCNGVRGLQGPVGVAVSADGNNVYVASAVSNYLTVFNRSATGAITYAQCFGSNSGAVGCSRVLDLKGAQSIGLSPGGGSLYVAATGDNVVDEFNRSSDGSLAFASCIWQSGSGGTSCAAANGLGTPKQLAVSPDGKNVYVTTPSSLVVLDRAADGTLTAGSCIGAVGVAPAGCTGVTANLGGAGGIAVSPDGANVYVASSTSNAVALFSRAADGSLAPRGCLGNPGTGPADCVTSVVGLADPTGVAISPDGKTVYVTASSGDIDTFARAPNGTLTFSSCVAASGGPAACGQTTGLEGADAAVVSPDGQDVYVTAGTSGSLVEFMRATAASSPATPTSTTAPTTTTVVTSTAVTTTTTKEPPAAELLFAKVVKGKHGNRTLEVRIRVRLSATAKVTLHGGKGAVLLEQTSTVPPGTTTFRYGLQRSIGSGSRELTVDVTARHLHRRFSAIVSVPAS